MIGSGSTKLMVVTSSGGHWIQMRRLRGAFTGFEVVYVTTSADYAVDVPGRKFYTVSDVSRATAWKLLVVVPQLLGILLKERPDVVVTTGALPGLVALALSRTFTKSRTLWIDSIANRERLSTSGVWAKSFSDAWLTQWSELAGPAGPSYWGAVL